MKHRSKILTWAYWLASRESAAIFVLLGIISQFAHIFFITFELSSLEGYFKIIQAVIMSVFFSCGLAYFILGGVKEGDESRENTRRKKLILAFTWVEVFINMMYWGNHLVWEPYSKSETINWFQFIMSIPFAILIPILLKAYGFSILVYEPSIEEEETEAEQEAPRNAEQEKEIEALNEVIASLDEKINGLTAKFEKGAYKLKFTGDGTDKVIDVELSEKSDPVPEPQPQQEPEPVEEPEAPQEETPEIVNEPTAEQTAPTHSIEEDIYKIFEESKPPKLTIDEELDAEMRKINEQSYREN